ncbi:prepilin-type N-terminal cleavage/methylation domain-containing protein [Halomonas sp. McH1-25]|uniref:PilW family protein n=1 Tax=unclassified Halomonas TaxID=2609666 RepID=UPI001EF590E5|nr:MULTISPECIES: prepilin-type N-terminal cleavage/methylation domain-containing protein [unclassified Halomonas]MCG7601900.1 prepilin-type N-terminal cleavage/methylation domain-containing protein [Halomonas sp. McH1-25]MCP1343907.1 prepilin-type N-terminal cleavage/methylation domain-containing protein [Halomonas sp. FL8]MCP1361879.1 prepilin-type N-terminal cleavage/methylation domain-containing protein [Halomonas sp. BBD45]MCP1363921.1 prepilin-type N-terminal cleavage/methylation domain-co
MKCKASNAGFTLVELMVALLIGLLIMLGAGQLYLTGFQNFKDIEALSDRQAALTYAADMLIRDIRRADIRKTCDDFEENDFELSLSVEGKCRYYGLKYYSDIGSVSLRLNIYGEGWQPVVSGFRDVDSFSVDPLGKGFFKITFELNGESEIVFHAQNRHGRF